MFCCEASEQDRSGEAYESVPVVAMESPKLQQAPQTDGKLPSTRRRALRSKADSQSEPIIPERPLPEVESPQLRPSQSTTVLQAIHHPWVRALSP
ncbi:hypothetical protein B484DRAFT_292389 [Ochromonadaceae sp. CCMP2298]|nr:hypothetical protein B484DRAFT_292389 [Ochromonadaceae sp. CCMP2298]